MIFKGFKFGMLLQIAIGPVCIFIFQLATLNGFYSAEAGVVGVTLVDGIFILASILGIAVLMKEEKTKTALKVFGAVILFIFGLSMVLGAFDINIIPGLNIQGTSDFRNSFIHTVILTASNPLTILFWAGVFSSRITDGNMKKKDIYLYGLGALISTAVFLTVIALSGNLVKPLFSATARQILNCVVGALLLFFSLKMVIQSINSSRVKNVEN